MPAPNNKCKMWSVYDGSLRRENRAALRALLAGTRLAKYDASHPRLDSGVLAIRDFILGARADVLVTCRGRGARECRHCFRANSFFTKKLLDTREAEGRPSITNWFSVSPGQLRLGRAGTTAATVRGGGGGPSAPAALLRQREEEPPDDAEGSVGGGDRLAGGLPVVGEPPLHAEVPEEPG
jgi:hypothetical protein